VSSDSRTWRHRFADRFDRALGSLPMPELVRRIVDHYRLSGDFRQEQLFADWSSLVGDKVGARTRPDTIVDRVLIVEVASSAWLHELRLIRPKIVSDLLDRLGMPRLFDDIRFVLAGERKQRRPLLRRPPARPVKAAPPPPTPASGEHLREIIQDASKVEDEELRELIARVRIKHDK
jgi:hypothetical protein